MNYLEKSLKRFLKRKVNVTTAVVVSFLITGSIGYAEDLIPKSENTEVLLFINGLFSKLENKSIKDIGGFTLGKDEINAPTTPGIDIIKPGQPGGPTTTIPGIDIIKPGQPGGPTTTIPGIDIIKPGQPGGPTTTIPGIDIIKPGEPGGPTTKPTEPEKPETIPGIDIIKPGQPGGPTTTIPGIDIIKPGEPGGPTTKPTEPEKPETIPGIDIIKPGQPGGPTTTIPGIDIIKPGQPGGPTTTIPGIDIIKPGEPGGPTTKPTEPEKPQENVNTENKVQENGVVFDVKEGENFINKGDITLKSDVDKLDVDKDGIFETPNKISAVIKNNGGTVVNEGYIKIEGTKDVDVAGTGHIIKTGEGMGVYQSSGTFTNKGTIYVPGNGYDVDNDGYTDSNGGYGVYIDGGVAINEGKIISDPPYEISAGLMPTRGIGMEAHGGEIINGENGVIENQLISMYAIGKGSNAINKGTINTHNIGLMALDGATATNHGTINAWFEGTENFPAESMIGLYASSYNGSTTKVINSEKGVVYGAIKTEGPAATVVNYGTIHGTEIISMKGNIENYGTITGIPTKPEGLVISSENGKFIQGVNGKLEADKVNGDIYLAGDYTKDNYSDEIKVNTDNISIKEHNGEIKSNSVMYNYNSDNKTLDRKNFNEIVQNSAIADYLENNYVDGDVLRQEIFNNLKAIDNNKDFNKATNNLFGNDVYPNMTRQTMDMINFNKQVMVDNIFNVNTSKDLRVIGGLDYKNIDTKSSNLSGYDEDVKAVFFGADKALSETQRLGVMANVGTLESKYDMNNAKREDTFFQGNIYHTYNKNNFSLTNNLFAGVSSGEVERDIKFANVEGHSKGDLDNKWIGLQNIASYRFDTDYFFFKPKLEANFTYLMQDSVKEDGNYGLEIEKSEKLSVEGGAGLEIGKDLYYNDYKVTLKAGANIYHEFANPYDGTDVKLRNVSTDTLKLADNDNDTRKDVSLRIELEKNNSFGIYGEYKHLFDDKNMFQVGMNYRF